LPVCRYGHEVPNGASHCPKCRASIKRFVKHMKVKLIENYNAGIFTLTKGLKGEALWETDNEYCVIFPNAVDRYGDRVTEPYWIPKKYLKKFSLSDWFF